MTTPIKFEQGIYNVELRPPEPITNEATHKHEGAE